MPQDEGRPRVEKILFTEPDWRSRRATTLQFDIPSYYYASSGQDKELLHNQMVMAQRGLRNFTRLDNSLGDRRLFYDQSFYQECYNPSNVKAEEKDYGLSELQQLELRRRDYDYALTRVPKSEIEAMEESMRTKIAQRSKGGAFQLRSTFKYLDRDGSGGIDYDETRNAFELLGLSFTESQILAFFASHDVDLQGAISYKSFIERLGEKDFEEFKAPWMLKTNTTHSQRQQQQQRRYEEQQQKKAAAAHRPTTADALAERSKAEEQEMQESMSFEESEARRLFNLLESKGLGCGGGAGTLDTFGLQTLLLLLGVPHKGGALPMLAEEVLLLTGQQQQRQPQVSAPSTTSSSQANKGVQPSADFPTFWRWWVDQQPAAATTTSSSTTRRGGLGSCWPQRR